MATIKIGGMLSTLANDNILASASQIYDESFEEGNLDQSTINALMCTNYTTIANALVTVENSIPSIEAISDSEITTIINS